MINDIELKTIEKRLDGIKEGVQRLRTILIITIIASSAILFVIFNSSFSRIHSMALAERDNIVKSDGRTFAELGKEVLLSDWYKSRNIQVNFLGISVNVTDLPVVGSITLTVITIWYFYSYRQTNRAIVGLLKEVSKYKQTYQSLSRQEIISLRKMIYISITQTSVFTKNDTWRTPGDRHSKGPSQLPAQGETAGKFQGKPPVWLRMFQRVKDEADRKMARLEGKLLGVSDRPEKYVGTAKKADIDPSTFTDKLVKLMFYLPFWTTFSIFIREIYNLLSSSPIQDSAAMKEREIFILLGLTPPIQDSAAVERLSAFDTFVMSRQIVSMYIDGHYWDIALAFFFIIIALLFVIYLRVLCNACLEFSYASTKSLWEFNEETAGMEGKSADASSP